MEKIRATLRIPTNEQYAYIETVVEGTPREIKEAYDNITTVVKENGPNPNDFYKFLELLIDSDLTEWGTIEDYNVLSRNQQSVMQSLKRFKKRLN